MIIAPTTIIITIIIYLELQTGGNTLETIGSLTAFATGVRWVQSLIKIIVNLEVLLIFNCWNGKCTLPFCV